MSRVRVAVGGVLMVGVLVGSASVGLAAWPLVLAPSAGQEPTMAFQPKVDGPGQLAVAHRQAIEVPGGLSQQLTTPPSCWIWSSTRQGEVTAVRPVSFAMRNETTASPSRLPIVAGGRGLLAGVAAAPAPARGRVPSRMPPPSSATWTAC